jgi:hypothetical protein
MIRPALLLLALFLFLDPPSAQVVGSQEQHRTFRIPFHTTNGLILLDATVNDNVATLVLDTGSGGTVVSPKAYGETQVHSHSLSEDAAGPGYLGLAKHMRADLKLADGARFNMDVSVISGVSLLAASQAADAITTRQLLGRGGWENNPLFGRHPSPAKQAGINLAFFAGESAVFYLTEHNRHAWIRWTGRAFLAHAVIEHSYLAGCNAGINTHAPEAHNCTPLTPAPF